MQRLLTLLSSKQIPKAIILVGVHDPTSLPQFNLILRRIIPTPKRPSTRRIFIWLPSFHKRGRGHYVTICPPSGAYGKRKGYCLTTSTPCGQMYMPSLLAISKTLTCTPLSLRYLSVPLSSFLISQTGPFAYRTWNWKRWLAASLWFAEAWSEPLSVVLASFNNLVVKGVAPVPLPHYQPQNITGRIDNATAVRYLFALFPPSGDFVSCLCTLHLLHSSKDTAFELLSVYNRLSVGWKAIAPSGHTKYKGDYELAWHLHSTLLALGVDLKQHAHHYHMHFASQVRPSLYECICMAKHFSVALMNSSYSPDCGNGPSMCYFILKWTLRRTIGAKQQ